jgi:uncharacterized protein (DUF983 family)
MDYCPHCGEEIHKGEEYCGGCGSRINTRDPVDQVTRAFTIIIVYAITAALFIWYMDDFVVGMVLGLIVPFAGYTFWHFNDARKTAERR